METSIQVLGLTVLAPVTVVTNLFLSAQCAVYHGRLRTGRGDRSGLWALFFLSMSAATLAGALKHGLPHALPSDLYALVLWISSLASAASIYCAQRATLMSHARDAATLPWVALPILQAVAFVGACLAVGPEMWLVVVNTAVGLIPVLVVESLAARRGSATSAWIAAGLGASTLSALAYVGHLSMGAWFNHVDLAHTLMGLSFFLMVRGGDGEETARVAFRLRPEAEEVA